MRHVIILFVILSSTSLRAAESPEQIADRLRDHDRAIHLPDDWMRDPYIILAPDGWYYLTCTRLNPAGSQQGIQLWRSKDLAQWQDRGALWSFSDSRWLGQVKPSERNRAKGVLLGAPELHLLDGRWVGVHTTNSRCANLIVNQGAELKGPFAEPMGRFFRNRHDPALFTDTMRHGTYNLYYCTANKITGPYGPRKFAGRCLGHGTIFKDKQNRWWCTAFCNANEPSLSPARMQTTAVSDTAYTLNRQGLTIVPMDIRVVDDEVTVKAKDPAYAKPGPEELQRF